MVLLKNSSCSSCCVVRDGWQKHDDWSVRWSQDLQWQLKTAAIHNHHHLTTIHVYIYIYYRERERVGRCNQPSTTSLSVYTNIQIYIYMWFIRQTIIWLDLIQKTASRSSSTENTSTDSPIACKEEKSSALRGRKARTFMVASLRFRATVVQSHSHAVSCAVLQSLGNRERRAAIITGLKLSKLMSCKCEA